MEVSLFSFNTTLSKEGPAMCINYTLVGHIWYTPVTTSFRRTCDAKAKRCRRDRMTDQVMKDSVLYVWVFVGLSTTFGPSFTYIVSQLTSTRRNPETRLGGMAICVCFFPHRPNFTHAFGLVTATVRTNGTIRTDIVKKQSVLEFLEDRKER